MDYKKFRQAKAIEAKNKQKWRNVLQAVRTLIVLIIAIALQMDVLLTAVRKAEK